ncbi:MAG: hypothetical protein QXJ62_02190 [Nitrososphaeria archaeon]
MSLEKIDEKQLLDQLKELFEEKRSSALKKVFAKVNLATKQFKDIWSTWWEGEVSPRQEIDLILVFSDPVYEEVSIIGVEVEYFRGAKKNPYGGLEQALSFSLFGFDSLVLWHIFTPIIENRVVESYVKTVSELVEGLNLPLVYFATKFFENREFEFFSPFSSSYHYEADSVLTSLLEYCKKKRNSLLYKEEVKRRRDVLKVILKIPR